MCEAPGSVVTLLCSGIQLYSAERRIADCILADVKRASMCTSAELARLSSSSEATITRLCHKLGFENYRKFQLALARDAMEQQETARRTREEGQDELRQALLDIQANREEELRATIQAIDIRQLRRVLSLLRSCEVIEVVSEGRSLPVALDASIRFGHLGKRCVASALHEKTLAFAQTLTPKDLLMAFSTSGRDAGLEEVISAAKVRGAPVLLISWPAAKGRLPGGVNAFLGQWFQGLHPSTPPVGASLRVIPCNTAAQHALLPGFAVADISTITETGMQSLGRTAVAFCPQPFQSGEYEALYGSDFL